jgi:alpha-mannosidase
MKKRSFILLMALFSTVSLYSQSFFTSDDCLINGYGKKTQGLDYEYYSCIPGLRESLIVRATSGTSVMEWTTDNVPSVIKEKYAAFIWIAAIGSGPGNARMDLSVDGKNQMSFFTDARSEWEVKGEGNTSLSFHSIMVDQYGDKHGYMILRIPSEKVTKGVPVTIKVTGSAANLNSWYMTFKKQVKTGITLNPFPAILKNGNDPQQLVEAAIFYFGKGNKVKIYANDRLLKETDLKFGYNAINLGLPVISKPTTVRLKAVVGDFVMENKVILNPVKKWKIDLIQHSHTDIGYTRSQTEILAEHLRYIDYALDYCDATDSYPDNAKFRWTCEASWPVDEYLKVRPASQVERLLKRIREGRIEVTGMYFNFDEIPDEQTLASSLEAAGRIRSNGINVSVAMQDDVNGIGWCMNDYFNEMGIRYLDMGTHGHRALLCFDRPTMFWWESPSGKRVLTFRAEHYMTGNTVLEIQSGDIDKFKNNLLNYLLSLEAKNYPYDVMSIQHSGYLTDNSPPSTFASDLIAQWNNIFEWPQLTTSTLEGFFREMQQKYAASFPVIRGAWPDWWTDGFGASAREVAATRAAEASLISNTAGLSMAAIKGIPTPAGTDEKIDLVKNALLFYTEHTTGYSESVREPFSQPTMEQRALKESYAWEANRRSASVGEEAMGLLQSLFRREKDPSLLVFNTLNWKRSGLVTVYIDHQIVPRGSNASIYDSEGKRLACQPLSSRSDGTYWAIWVKDIPPFGYKKFIVKPEEAPIADKSSGPDYILENKWYRIVTDKNRGIIKSMIDKDLDIELIDQASQYGLGEFILEKLGNRAQMESKRLDDFKRLPLDTIWFDSASKGEVWNSIKFYGESETAIGPRGFSIEYRLYNCEKRADISCSIVKKSITDPESFYIAFPFQIDSGKHYTEVQGGIIETGKDQIKGSSNDWYTVQNFTAVRNSNSQIIMGCGEMPLMQFGAINTGRYQAGAMPQSTHIFSWPMNNYWVTNFNADQRGGHSWTYYLTSSGDISNTYASRFGWGARVPFLTRIIPGAGTGDNMTEGSFITGWPENVVLISAMPADNGKYIIIHVRETGGTTATLELKNGETGEQLMINEVDPSGKEIAGDSKVIGPLESRFFRINTGNK